jgi:histidinol-phosphate/aromatic aminotransferase/cobyric acid decarboxylase-like protein
MSPGDELALSHHGDSDVRPGEADHAVNVLAGDPPEWVLAAIAEALSGRVTRYPDERAAVAAIAALHGRTPDEVVLTNGATEAMWLLGAALKPRLSAITQPAFTETELALIAAHLPVAHVQRDPEAGFALDPSAVPPAATLLMLANPASPDGTLHDREQVLALRAPGRTLVVDEAFMAMVPGEPGSLAGERLDDVIVLRSLTKLLSVPGLRVGYALAPAPLARALRAVRPPWSVNAFALAVLVAAAGHRTECADLAVRAAAEGRDLAARLSAIPGVRIWPAATNYRLVQVVNGDQVRAGLHARGLAVRGAGSFRGLTADHLRITARDPERNAVLAAVLAELLAEPPAGPRGLD